MIHENLKMLRQHHKLTQEQLALELNVSRQVIAKWEKGDSVPDLQHSMAIAKLFNVTLDNLVHYKAEHQYLPVPPQGKYFFGATTVGERGQIVIPEKARELFHIQPGDSILVLGDEDRGLAIVPKNMLHTFINMTKASIDTEE